jgi:hypothetical protein
MTTTLLTDACYGQHFEDAAINYNGDLALIWQTSGLGC